MKCLLCESGNIDSSDFQTVGDLVKHLITHDIHNLAFAYADMLFILEERRIRKEEKDKKL